MWRNQFVHSGKQAIKVTCVCFPVLQPPNLKCTNNTRETYLCSWCVTAAVCNRSYLSPCGAESQKEKRGAGGVEVDSKKKMRREKSERRQERARGQEERSADWVEGAVIAVLSHSAPTLWRGCAGSGRCCSSGKWHLPPSLKPLAKRYDFLISHPLCLQESTPTPHFLQHIHMQMHAQTHNPVFLFTSSSAQSKKKVSVKPLSSLSSFSFLTWWHLFILWGDPP